MAKDPAFLFYPSDWHLGTMHFTILEKGAYLELLILQFSLGKFTEAQAKHMLNGSFDLAWANVKQKFKTDGIFYWNERLISEQEKRKKFTESRRINGLQTKKSKISSKKTNKHMHKHMENENINENIIINSFEKSEKLFCKLSNIEGGATVEYIERTTQKKYTKNELENLFAAFKLQYDKEFYQNRNKVIQHFRNWLKQQNGQTNHSNGIKSNRDKQADASAALVEKLGEKLRAIAGTA